MNDLIYFLRSGAITVELPISGGEKIFIDRLNTGSCFGLFDAFSSNFTSKFNFRA